ncbi:MAG: hypothetical protein AAGH74_09345 [Pseudomonadota bacterium]
MTMSDRVARKIIGTFHKTGTNLWKPICWQAHREGVFRLWDLDTEVDYQNETAVCTDSAHSLEARLKEHSASLDTLDRLSICIRDPRDVIVSSAYYHCKTSEEWCHAPDKRFGGLTYQEKINSYENRQDQFLFEMENVGHFTISSMTKTKGRFDGQNCIFCRLEDLSHDYKLEKFHEVYSFLNFNPGQIVDLLAISLENSLFAKPDGVKQHHHARSISTAQFLREFEDRTRDRFNELFPDSVAKLGYPEDGLEIQAPDNYSYSTDEDGSLLPRRRHRDTLSRELGAALIPGFGKPLPKRYRRFLKDRFNA